jgi:hypothetical protein
MANSEKPPVLGKDDASVASPLNVHIAFDCGVNGRLFAAKGINLSRLKLPMQQGKIIKVSTTAGFIVVQHIGADVQHTTLLGIDKKHKGPDELHIRVPVGVNFFEIDVPPIAKANYDRAFFFQTGDGYNIIPHFLPIKPQTDPQQTIKELILITSHVPPRSGHIDDRDTEKIPMLTAGELDGIQKSDAPYPPQPPGPKRGTS